MTPGRQYSYRLYGLVVRSDRELVGLESCVPVASGDPVVEVVFKSRPPNCEDLLWREDGRFQDRLQLIGGAIAMADSADGRWVRTSFQQGPTFHMTTSGSAVFVDEGPMSHEATCSLLVNNMLAMCLRLRGRPVLHAGAVEVAGAVVALMGPSGAGKSTSVFGFARSGRRVLTDDVCALQITAHGTSVWPGAPRIRLWPETVDAVIGRDHAVPLVAPEIPKCVYDLPRDHEDAPVPLWSLVFLDGYQDQLRLEPLEPATALMLLVENGYLSHWIGDDMRRRDFSHFSQIAATTPAFRFWRPRDLDALGESVEFLAAELGASGLPTARRNWGDHTGQAPDSVHR